jgi:hypothetical protein
LSDHAIRGELKRPCVGSISQFFERVCLTFSSNASLFRAR